MIVNTLKNICRYVSLNFSLEKKTGLLGYHYSAGFISIFSRNATYSTGVRISGNSRCWCYYLIGHVYRKINELSNEDLRKSRLGFRHRILSFFFIRISACWCSPACIVVIFSSDVYLWPFFLLFFLSVLAILIP